MKKLVATIALTLTLLTSLFAQDVMQTGVKHIKVLAEDDKVRVLHFTPSKGDKTPVHSHPKRCCRLSRAAKFALPWLTELLRWPNLKPVKLPCGLRHAFRRSA